jgi:hypothetical protein
MMIAPGWRYARAALSVVLACMLAALLTWLLLPAAEVEAWMGETGPVERVTAASYALCAVAAWILRRRGDDWRSTLAISTVMTAFCMRELDWHKAFTGSSVLRVSWYVGPASVQAKIIAALVLGAVLAAMAWLVMRHAPWLWRAWQRHEPVSLTVVMFLGVLVLAKSLDRSVGILVDDLHVGVPLHWKALRTALEEWLELALSMLLLLGLVQHRAAARSATIERCASP